MGDQKCKKDPNFFHALYRSIGIIFFVGVSSHASEAKWSVSLFAAPAIGNSVIDMVSGKLGPDFREYGMVLVAGRREIF